MTNPDVRKKYNNLQFEEGKTKFESLTTKHVANARNYAALNELKNRQLHEDQFESVALLEKRQEQDFLYYNRVYDANRKIVPEKTELAIMTPMQQELLKLYGPECIVIDSTHGTSRFNLQLTTVMVIDSHK